MFLENSVPESIRKEMMDTSLESMLTFSRGVELKRDLVVAAIHKYGSNYLHAGYDIVSDFLQRKCPSFFKPSDMAFYKVSNESQGRHISFCICTNIIC
jgi:nuclear pore complex protein Nup155